MLTAKVLTSIVERFDDGFQSVSRKKRMCTAFKAVTHSKHIHKFRESLNETKSTLTLAMVHEWYASKSFTNNTIQSNSAKCHKLAHLQHFGSQHITNYGATCRCQ
jgi:hypothetical protein